MEFNLEVRSWKLKAFTFAAALSSVATPVAAETIFQQPNPRLEKAVSVLGENEQTSYLAEYIREHSITVRFVPGWTLGRYYAAANEILIYQPLETADLSVLEASILHGAYLAQSLEAGESCGEGQFGAIEAMANYRRDHPSEGAEPTSSVEYFLDRLARADGSDYYDLVNDMISDTDLTSC